MSTIDDRPHDQSAVAHMRPGLELAGYSLQRQIGEGAFGVVFACTEKKSGKRCAIKQLPRTYDEQTSEELRDGADAMREAKIMGLLDHPNLCQLLDVVVDSQNILFVFELIDGIELYELIVANQRLTDDEMKLIFRQVLCGVQYMHALSIVHRDLKPENILISGAILDEDGEYVVSEKHILVKIIDFGLSKQVSSENSCVGTPIYMAPEVVAVGKSDAKRLLRGDSRIVDSSYGTSLDCYSLGILLFVGLAGEYPSFARQNGVNRLKSVNFPANLQSVITPLAQSFILSLTHGLPTSRLSVNQALADLWFGDQFPTVLPIVLDENKIVPLQIIEHGVVVLGVAVPLHVLPLIVLAQVLPAEVLIQVAPVEILAKAIPVEALVKVVPVEILVKMVPVEVLAKVVPVEALVKVVPVEILAKVVPVEALVKVVPVEILAKVVPVEILAKVVPVEDLVKVVPVEILAKVVPVEALVKVVPVEILAKVVPVEALVKVVPVEILAKVVPVEALVKVVPVEDLVKVVPVEILAKVVPVEILAKVVPVEILAKVVPVEDLVKVVPVEILAKVVPVEDLVKVVPVEILAKVVPVEDLVKVVPVEVLAKVVPVKALVKVVPVEILAKVVPVEALVKVVPVEILAKVVPVEDLVKVIPIEILAQYLPADVLAKILNVVEQTNEVPSKTASALRQTKQGSKRSLFFCFRGICG